jgi:hypothetical protein
VIYILTSLAVGLHQANIFQFNVNQLKPSDQDGICNNFNLNFQFNQNKIIIELIEQIEHAGVDQHPNGDN